MKTRQKHAKIRSICRQFNCLDFTEKINAIKAVRFEYRLGLKVAKEMVECYIDFVQKLQRGV